MKVYFLPGMCVNCRIFDKITLPEGYEKIYIEWIMPEEETLNEYAHKMAESIDVSEPFILAGYSMGGIIMQEMNRFLKPEKNILISSIKTREEIPPLFRIAKRSHITKNIPQPLYRTNKKVSNLFAHLVFSMNDEEIEECIAYTSAPYMKWTTYQITEWEPQEKCCNLYHIHGTRDQIFPFRQIKDVFEIEDGDHIMILRKSEEVNRIITRILLS